MSYQDYDPQRPDYGDRVTDKHYVRRPLVPRMPLGSGPDNILEADRIRRTKLRRRQGVAETLIGLVSGGGIIYDGLQDMHSIPSFLPGMIQNGMSTVEIAVGAVVALVGIGAGVLSFIRSPKQRRF